MRKLGQFLGHSTIRQFAGKMIIPPRSGARAGSSAGHKGPVLPRNAVVCFACARCRRSAVVRSNLDELNVLRELKELKEIKEHLGMTLAHRF